MISLQYPILIVIVPLMTALIILLVGRWFQKSCYYLAVLAMTITILCAMGLFWEVHTRGIIHYRLGDWPPPLGIEYVIDYLSAFVILIVVFIGLNVVIYSKKSVEKELPNKIVPFYCILLLLVTGLIGIVATGDMFNLYVFLEVSSLTAYGLIGLGGKRAPLASFRYLIMGTIGASFYLLGVGFIYLMTGTLNMADIAARLPDLYHAPTILVAFSFLVVGIGLKLALFPLHSWLPDAYTHAPSTVSAFVAATMTKVAAYIMFRIIFTVFRPIFSIETVPITSILAWMGVIAMVAGSLFAIQQTSFKRMLAYSSVAQIGYIVLGIGLVNRLGLTGGLLHILNHAFMKGCLFMIAGAIIYKFGIRDIRQFHGIYKKMPLTIAAFIVAAFSMIGIPPTAGFFSKLYLILGAMDGGIWIFVSVIILSSLLNVVYFINVMKHIFFGVDDSQVTPDLNTGSEAGDMAVAIPLTMQIPIAVTALGILLLGIFNGPIVHHIIRYIIPASLY